MKVRPLGDKILVQRLARPGPRFLAPLPEAAATPPPDRADMADRTPAAAAAAVAAAAAAAAAAVVLATRPGRPRGALLEDDGWPPDLDGGGHLTSVWLPLTALGAADAHASGGAATDATLTTVWPGKQARKTMPRQSTQQSPSARAHSRKGV